MARPRLRLVRPDEPSQARTDSTDPRGDFERLRNEAALFYAQTLTALHAAVEMAQSAPASTPLRERMRHHRTVQRANQLCDAAYQRLSDFARTAAKYPRRPA